MYDFFNKALATAKGKSTDSSFIYIDNAVRKNHINIQNYIYSSSLAVPPDHLIPKILQSIPSATYQSNGRQVVWAAKDVTNRLGSALDITCATAFGTSFTNQLLDGGIELYMLTSEDFDLNTPWEKLTPIEFRYHTYTNVNFKLGAHRDESGIGMITINVPMLAYQYHKWQAWSRLNQIDENVYHFAVKYPIWNSIKSYIDISQFNRCYYRMTSQRILPDVEFGPQCPTVNIIPQLVRANTNILSILSNKAMTIGQVLNNIPVFFAGSALDLTDNLDCYNTRQTDWFTMLYQLPFIDCGLATMEIGGGTVDERYVSKLKYELNAFIGARGLETLPKQTSLHIIEKLFTPLEDRLHRF